MTSTNKSIQTGYYFYDKNYYLAFGTLNVKNEVTGEWKTFVHYTALDPRDHRGFNGRDIDVFSAKYEFMAECTYEEIDSYYEAKYHEDTDVAVKE